MAAVRGLAVQPPKLPMLRCSFQSRTTSLSFSTRSSSPASLKTKASSCSNTRHTYGRNLPLVASVQSKSTQSMTQSARLFSSVSINGTISRGLTAKKGFSSSSNAARLFSSSTSRHITGEEPPSAKAYISSGILSGRKNLVDVKKVLVIGSGGLSIGQAGEFDYSGEFLLSRSVEFL